MQDSSKSTSQLDDNSPLLRWLVPSVLALALAVIAAGMTWPLVPNITRAVTDPGDPYINAFTLDWVSHKLTTDPHNLFDSPLFHPERKTLAFTEHLIGLALFALPFHVADVPPLLTYNLLFLLSFVANGLAAYLLVGEVTSSRWAGCVAALVYAFLPYRMAQASHLQHIWSPWLPLSLWALLRLYRKPSLARACILAFTIVMLGLSNVHWLLFGLVALSVSAALIAFYSATPLRFTSMALIAIATGCLVLLPTLLPYRWVAREYGMVRSHEETAHFSAHLSDWLIPSGSSKIWRGAAIPHEGERRLFPGVLMPLGAIVGLFFLRRRDFAPAYRARSGKGPPLPALLFAAWIILGVIGSLGLNGPFHRLLFEYIEPFRALRVPARWAIVTYTGMAALSGAAVAWLMRRDTLLRRTVVVIFCTAFLYEVRTAPVRWFLAPEDESEVYEWLRTSPHGGGVIELPIWSMSSEYEYTLAAAGHRRATVNGASGFASPTQARLAALFNQSPIPNALIDELRAADVRLIILHADRMGEREEDTVSFLMHHRRAGRLAYIGRFFHDHRGDYVFALTGGGQEIPQVTAKELVESELDELTSRRFLATDRLVGLHYLPRPGAKVTGELTVDGWAVSLYPITSATVLFNNGRIRIPAEFYARDDLREVYPGLSRIGYRLTLRKPPEVWRNADVEVEVTDAAGRRRRLPQVWFDWE
jgi:hypothetical protein